MIGASRGRVLFNIFGVVVVAFWLTMMGMLVKKLNFTEHVSGITYEDSEIHIDSAQREWKDIFLKGRKVGYAVNLIKPFQEGYFIQEEIFLRINLMGLERGVYTLTQSRVDNRFLLKSFFFKMTSGIVNYSISGRVEGDQLHIVTGKGKEKRTQEIKLSETPMIGAGMGHIFKTRKIRVGDTVRMPFFDPSTMAQKEMTIKVAARESLKIRGISYDAFRLEAEMWGRPMKFWVDEEGSTLKEEGFMGLTTIRSSAANAPLEIEGSEEDDFYELAAIRPDREISHPERLSFLKVRIEGLEDAPLVSEELEGGRQQFRENVLEVKREKLPLEAAYSIPYAEGEDELLAALRPEFNIESDAEEIIEKAREIAGNDKDPTRVSRKLMRWVYKNVEKRPVVSIPSALEVLRTRVGDCNEHATLLAALLRASGIPARLSVGIVYTRKSFYYHAWTEAYVGTWISMDATMNQMPADASHIRLMHGNLDKQVELAGLIGKLELELLDTKHD